MYEIAVCDDIPMYYTELSAMLEELAMEFEIVVNIDIYKSISQLASNLNSKHYDLIITDTSIKGISGIDFVMQMRREKCETDVIFTSKTADDAVAAYSAFPLGYLIKPVQKKKLRHFFRKATQKYSEKPAIILKSADGGTVSVNRDDLLYIEVIGNELDVYLRKEKIDCTGSLSEVYSQLPQKQFYRSHRSFIVNLMYVTRIVRYQFIMEDGKKVTIAKNRYAETKKAFCEFAGVGL